MNTCMNALTHTCTHTHIKNAMSGGKGMGEVMKSKKFQDMARNMMSNPEIARMMQVCMYVYVCVCVCVYAQHDVQSRTITHDAGVYACIYVYIHTFDI